MSIINTQRWIYAKDLLVMTATCFLNRSCVPKRTPKLNTNSVWGVFRVKDGKSPDLGDLKVHIYLVLPRLS